MEAGKGDTRRPSQIGSEEEELRYALARGSITRDKFDRQYAELLLAGRIIRSGRVLKNVG